MKSLHAILVFCAASSIAQTPQVQTPQAPAQPAVIPNAHIDAAGHRRAVIEATRLRETRRLTEERFLELAADPSTVVLDARSADKFKLRHIKGAVNLPFTDFTADALAKVIPAKDTRVLIYCNNNFGADPAAFPGKRIEAALNLSTFANLAIYGYTNVFELGPFLDVRTTRIPFEGDGVGR
jgi:phage shock protein E